MNCPKCGTILQTNAKFCRRCGANIQTDSTNTHAEQYQYNFNYSNKSQPKYNIDSLAGHAEQYNYSYNYSNKEKTDYNTNQSHQEQYDYNYIYSKFNYIPTQTAGDEKYLEAFIGPSYNTIKNSKFSIGTFFFGIFYILYRKMYSLSFAYLVLTLASFFLLGEYATLVNIIIRIIMAFKFNELYLAYAERKVEQIKQSNFDKTSLELLDECRKKGGVSLAKVITIIIIGTIIIPFILLIIGFMLPEKYIKEENTSSDKETINEFSTPYQLNNLTYSKQTNLLPIIDQNNYKVYYYKSDNATCNVSIKAINNDKNYTAYSYLVENNSYNNIDTTVSNIFYYDAPNITWNGFTVKNSNNIKGLYATTDKEYLYTITTEHASQYDNNCQIIYKQLFDSTKFIN